MKPMTPPVHRFLFFPMGTESEITVIPFLELESSAVILLPPVFYEVIKRHFENDDNITVNDKRVILYVINDSIFNDIVTNENVLQEMLSCTEDNFASICFIGVEDKLVVLASYFRDFCSKKQDVYFHSPLAGDTAYTITKVYKSPGNYIYRLTAVTKEHFVGKN